MLPVFVINLDRSPDRLARFGQQCDEAGVQFERFPAVDGTDLPSRLKPYFCDESGRIVSPLKPAEIGCYASHLGVWQQIVDRDIPAAMICEDDAVLPAPALIGEALSGVPSTWDVIRLSAEINRRVLPVATLSDGRILARPLRSTTNLVAYCITRDGAGKLLREGLRTLPVDRDMTRTWAFDLCEFAVLPPLVVQTAGEPSTIGARSRDRSPTRRLREKWLRLAFNLRVLGLLAMFQAARVPVRRPATS